MTCSAAICSTTIRIMSSGFWREAYSSGFTQRPDLTMMGVVSGLEMACWDIIGKAAGKPVYELLGGLVNERLRSYTYLYPKNQPRRIRLRRPRSRRRMRGAKREARLHGGQVRSGRPVHRVFGSSAFDGSARPLRDCSAAGCAKPWAARPTCCSARTGRWCRRRRSGSRSVSKNTIRCGSKSRCRRAGRRDGASRRSTPAFRSRRASV